VTNPSQTAAARLQGVGKTEFIAMMAALMALNALAIDIMLPGLQQIGESLGVADPNHRQYVVSAYLFGFGVAQLLYGPLSDRFGRRKPLLAGLGIYIVSAIAVVFFASFCGLLIRRLKQGRGSGATPGI
jgi:DHA1 family bicyclomycin/chloramphenicol resistance-like MFS transporter